MLSDVLIKIKKLQQHTGMFTLIIDLQLYREDAAGM